MAYKIFFTFILFIQFHTSYAGANDKVTFSYRDHAQTCRTGSEHCLDLHYSSTSSKKLPLIIFIHGGGWTSGSHDSYAIKAMGRFLVEQGFAFASVGYRLHVSGDPTRTVTKVSEDVAASIAFLQNNVNLSNYNILKDRILLMGHSAGAHLAALAATHPDLLSDAGGKKDSIYGTILLDGSVYDFASTKNKNKYLLSRLFDDSEIKTLSPVVHVKNEAEAYGPFLILSGDDDKVPNSKDDPSTWDDDSYPYSEFQAKKLHSTLRNDSQASRLMSLDIGHGDFLKFVYDSNTSVSKEVLKFARYAFPFSKTRIKALPSKFLTNKNVFNWRTYIARNNSLFDRGKDTEAKLEAHWRNSGIKAGRVASHNFEPAQLSAKFPRLKKLYGNDFISLTKYFANYGYYLGYRAEPKALLFGGMLPLKNMDLPDANAMIGNQKLRMVTYAKYAGAITELWVKDRQIVDSTAKGYGRLLQIAGWKYGLGACYNPIEAGGRYTDDRGETTKTIVETFKVSNGELETMVIPSLFRLRGEDESNCMGRANYPAMLPNHGQRLDRKIRFGKHVKLNALGNPNIIEIKIKIDSYDDVSGFIFQLYAALDRKMDTIETIDLKKCISRSLFSPGNCRLLNRTDDLISRKYSPDFPAIISYPKGNVAFTLYSPHLVKGVKPTYVATRRNGLNDPDATTDMAINYNTEGLYNKESLEVPIYIVVGSKAAVHKNLLELVKQTQSLQP